jgi:hypothetical protein
VLPEQGRSLATPLRSRAGSRRHGAATSSARTWRPGYLTLPAGCGYSPASGGHGRLVLPNGVPAVATVDQLSG